MWQFGILFVPFIIFVLWTINAYPWLFWVYFVLFAIGLIRVVHQSDSPNKGCAVLLVPLLLVYILLLWAIVTNLIPKPYQILICLWPIIYFAGVLGVSYIMELRWKKKHGDENTSSGDSWSNPY
jgi:hypothetical protein